MSHARIKPNPADAKRLYDELMNIYFTKDNRANMALSWFEHAYAINSTLSTQPENLNVLYKALVAQSGSMRKHAKKAFELVLAIGLLKHPHESEHYLETLWHYLSAPKKESRLDHFASALFKVEYKPLIPASTENPCHAAVLHALTIRPDLKSNNQAYEYLERLSNAISHQGANEETLAAIDFLGRTTPQSFPKLGSMYTANLDYKNINIDLGTQEKKLIAAILFREKKELFRHALMGVNIHITRTVDLHVDIGNGSNDPVGKEKIALTFDLFKQVIQGIDTSIINSHIFDAFRRLDTVNTNDREIFSAHNEIGQLILTCGNHFDEMGIPWRKLLAGAINNLDFKESSMLSDFTPLIGQAMLDNKFRPIKRAVALMLLEEMPQDELLVAFQSKPRILAEMYKLNNNQELLQYITPSLRKDCIQHDLGL